MKRILTIISVFVFSTLFAQVPANDACVSPQIITIPSSGNICINSTNVNATSDLTTDACDTGTPGNEVWFTYTVTGGQNTVTVTPTGTPAAQQLVVTLNSTGCASGTYNTCDASATNGGSASATWAYTIGTQVLISIETNGNPGGFQLCITSITPPPSPGSTCNLATILCNKNNFSLPVFPNNVNVITPSCFPTPFQNPVFYKFTVGQAGTCIWNADPQGNAEYDWVMYDITGGCPGTEVCCNFNYANSNGSPVGMATGGAGACGTSGFDGAASEFSPPANVVVGNTYLIIIDNYTTSSPGNSVGFNFTWGGTFEIAPVANFSLSPTTACGPLTTTITNSSVASVSYSWIFGNGNTSTSPNPPTQTYNTPGTYLVSLVTTSATGCTDVASQSIIVKPVPVVNPITDITVCKGATVSASAFTATPAGATFAWTNSNTAIGLAGSGTGDYASFVATNTGATPITSTITVTPTLNGCAGSPITYAITVKPTPTVTDPADQTLCANTATTTVSFAGNIAGTTYDWTNTTTSIGLAASGTGDIASFTAINNGTAPVVSTITVTPTINGCTGTPQLFTITVNPIPTVTDPADQVLCANTATTTVTFAGNVAGTTYNWTNNTTSIGLTASGSGNIASFTALNAGLTDVVSTVTVTPTINSCPGTPQTFTFTVNPIPTVTDPTDQALCANTPTTGITFAGNMAGVTYNWTNNTPSIGLSANGTGDISSFIATNAGSAPLVSTVTVTPAINGCAGTPQLFTFTVNPIPTVTDPTDQVLCANAVTTTVTFAGNMAGVTYNWTNDNTTSGLAAAGSGNIPSFTAINAGTIPVISTVTVTPIINGCIGASQIFTITINPIPITTVNSPTICPTQTATLTAGGSATTFTWTAGLSSTTGTTVTGSPVVTTSYTVTGTALGCSSTAVATITIGGNIVVTVNDTTICEGETATLTASGAATYSWTAGLSSTTGATVTGSPVTTTSYTVTGSTGGCSGTAVSTITINPLPVLFITNPAGVCSPLTVDITAAAVTAGSTGGGVLSYWTNPAATNPLTTPTSISNSATYYIQSITAAGCKDIEAVTVIINNTPVLVITNPLEVCSPLTIDITAAAVTAGSTGGGTLSYWTTNAATTSVATPAAISTSGTYYIQTLTAAGCKDIKPVVVTINPLPILIITDPAPVCSPLTVDITAPAVTSGSTGGGALSYWTDATATTPLTTPASITNSGTYYIQSLTAAGCKDIKPVTVLINTTPVLVITDPLAVCSPLTIDITAAAVTAGSTGGGTLSYWTTIAATTSVATPAAISTSGTYYIQSLTAAGCKDIQPVVVTINPLPILVITDPAPVCSPLTVDITAAAVTSGSTGGGALSYWTDATATTSLTTPASIATSGTYYIQSLTAAGCKDIKPVTVLINTTPVLVITEPLAVCSPLTIDITAPAVTAGSTGGGTLSYWTDITATTPLTTPTAVALSGTYYIQTTTSGCKDIDQVLVTINPLPVLTITDPAAVCAPNNIDITAAAVTSGSTGGGTLSYWTDATATTPLTTPTAVATSGTYYIKTTTSAGCIDIKPVLVTINPLPTPMFTADNLSGCSPVCVNFTDGTTVASGTITSWNWDFGGAGVSSTQNPSFCFTISGQYNVTLSATTNSGCNSISTPTVITVFPDPMAEFNPTPNPASVLDATVTMNNQSSADVTYWYWTFGDGDSLSPNTPSPIHTYPDDMAGNYTATLIVHNANGCYATVSHEIIIAPEFTFFIPNAFSPNGDFINDTFYGQGIGIEKYEIYIFDRWGNNVFYGDDVSKAWDGKANHGSEVAQQDVYVWKVKLLDVLGKTHNYIGTVTIVK